MFQVRGDDAAYIALSEVIPDYPTDEMYEVDLEHRQASIKKGEHGTELTEYDGDVRDRNEFTTFWIQWANYGEVTVGKGTLIGQKTIMTADDTAYPRYEAKHLALAGDNIDWRFCVPGMGPFGKILFSI